jgi:hypothetical protein
MPAEAGGLDAMMSTAAAMPPVRDNAGVNRGKAVNNPCFIVSS